MSVTEHAPIFRTLSLAQGLCPFSPQTVPWAWLKWFTMLIGATGYLCWGGRNSGNWSFHHRSLRSLIPDDHALRWPPSIAPTTGALGIDPEVAVRVMLANISKDVRRRIRGTPASDMRLTCLPAQIPKGQLRLSPGCLSHARKFSTKDWHMHATGA